MGLSLWLWLCLCRCLWLSVCLVPCALCIPNWQMSFCGVCNENHHAPPLVELCAVSQVFIFFFPTALSSVVGRLARFVGGGEVVCVLGNMGDMGDGDAQSLCPFLNFYFILFFNFLILSLFFPVKGRVRTVPSQSQLITRIREEN